MKPRNKTQRPKSKLKTHKYGPQFQNWKPNDPTERKNIYHCAIDQN